MKPIVSYVVLTKGSEKTLKKCLEQITAQKIAKEIIVVDNNSIDDTLTIAKSFGARIYNEPEGNMAVARNMGLDNALGRYTAFVDSDCYLTVDWTKKMIEHVQKMDVVGAGALNYSNTRSWVSDKIDDMTDARFDRGIREINSIWTMNALYDMEKVGDTRFNPLMKRVGEDLEFNFQLREKGLKLLMDTRTHVYHENPITIRELIKKSYNYGKGFSKPFKLHKHERWQSGVYIFRVFYLFSLFVSLMISLYTSTVYWFFLFILMLPFLGALTVKLNPVFAFVFWIKQLSATLGMVEGVVR